MLLHQKERAAAMNNENDLSALLVQPPVPPAGPCLLPGAPPLSPPYPASCLRPPLPHAVDAFIACGGQPDLSGYVEKDRLVKIIKEDFGLTLDIEKLISRYDGDGTGQMEYSECVQRCALTMRRAPEHISTVALTHPPPSTTPHAHCHLSASRLCSPLQTLNRQPPCLSQPSPPYVSLLPPCHSASLTFF